MDRELFDQLLDEGEGTTLDFKQQQYAFGQVDDVTASELLKDILGFANALRRADAFVLIGVKEIRGDRAQVVGIPKEDHLLDHSLQQFVNSRTNAPVEFKYEEFQYDGLQIGIIQVMRDQPRPLFLPKKFGKLQANQVYIRRGSSTDVSRPANPTEIARLAVSQHDRQPILNIAFADPVRESAIGHIMKVETTLLALPKVDDIPTVDEAESMVGFQPGDFPLPIVRPRSFADDIREKFASEMKNQDFIRDWAGWELARQFLFPSRLTIENTGQAEAAGVLAEIEIDNPGEEIVIASKLPARPKRKTQRFSPKFDPYDELGYSIASNTEFIDREGKILIKVDFGRMQPGRQFFSDVFYLGKRSEGTIQLSTRVLASNLPTPVKTELTAKVCLTTRHLDVGDVIKLSNEFTEEPE
ncbi:AlbA family DNA-binding domain-containing protein [Bremerella alba]|uniref:Schlafen AlbA-2 domain-containing protein n=1 Tax=Bremerella alba TaxID=980252 RepID=A0A7V8V740_9BACT|nr:ATP-binding protein [Bremerella alba]MBA2116086.1 hypothetical protein [Bremerella alba]